MKTLITTLSVLLLASPFSFAQKGKAVKQLFKPTGKIRASSALRGTGSNLGNSFSRSTAELEAAVSRLSFKPLETSIPQISIRRLETNLGISIQPHLDLIPKTAEMGYTGANALSLVSLSRSDSPVKDILNAETTFLQWYVPEVKNANKLLSLVANMEKNGTLFTNAAAMQRLQAKIDDAVINHSLKRNLQADIANRDYSALVHDLADYYTLPRNYAARGELGDLVSLNAADAFARSTASYLARHPHQITLKLRRLMTHPAVDGRTKEMLQGFINKNALSAAEVDELIPLLKQAYQEHATALTALRTSPEIEVSVQTYEHYLAELKNFIAENGRLPSWNTLNRAEQSLHQELALLTMRDSHLFEPLKSLSAEIRSIIAQHTPAPVPFEEVLPQLQAFCAKHHRLPAAYSFNPNASVQEARLQDQYVYWQIHGTSEQKQALDKLTF